MVRRPKSQGDELELDSLMDCMTNVVGVLILVLLMVQLNVQETVKQIIRSSTITKEDLESSQQKLDGLLTKRETLNQQRDSFDLASERERMERLQDTVNARKRLLAEQQKESNTFSMKIESDRKKAVEAQKEVELNEEERTKLQDNIAEKLKKKAELQARLDRTPVKAAPPPKILSIPNPRPAIAGSKRLNMLCVNNKLYPMSIDDIRKDIEERSKTIITKNRLNLDPQAGIDPAKFAEHYLEMRTVNDDFFTTTYHIEADRFPRFKMIPREDKGFPPENLMSLRSSGRRLLGSIPAQQFYVVFYVLPDSYDVYITARKILMDNGVQAGWEAVPQTYVYEARVPNIELGPPRPKPPAPTTPQPPAKPNNVLD